MNSKIMLAAVSLVFLTSSSLEAKRGGRGSALASRTGLASYHDYNRERSSYYLAKGSNITASREFPCGTIMRVTNVKNGKSISVIVRDHGPAKWTGRILDLNKSAFAKIANVSQGQIKIKLKVLKMGKCKIHRH